MSREVKNSLAPPEASSIKDKQRKMTQAIIEDQEREKEVYEFLEDDDNFEEFDNEEVDYDALVAGDVEMDGGMGGPAKSGDDYDRKLWHTDWDDEEQSAEFIA